MPAHPTLSPKARPTSLAGATARVARRERAMLAEFALAARTPYLVTPRERALRDLGSARPEEEELDQHESLQMLGTPEMAVVA